MATSNIMIDCDESFGTKTFFEYCVYYNITTEKNVTRPL